MPHPVLLILFLSTGFVVSTIPSANTRIISPSLLNTLQNKGSANIFIRMSAGVESILNNLNQLNFADRTSKITTIVDNLKAHASSSQHQILQFLAATPAPSTAQFLRHRSFWISNEVFIAGADLETIIHISTLPGVQEIYEEPVFSLSIPIQNPTSKEHILLERGVQKIQADLVWSDLGVNGSGVIVANIDSGVRGTHEALAPNFLGRYGWFDPRDGSAAPEDTDGHGTHTMGTLAGGLGIGVAPGALWMACKGCSNGCLNEHLLMCAEYITCPTLADGSAPDCSKAPHLVSNSWGARSGFGRWFESAIQVWKAAGITPIFANGNGGGEGCATTDSPADTPVGVIAVGNTDLDDLLGTISGRGPTVYGQIKPDLTAPGTDIGSAAHTGDNDYGWMSGTSMATPHVAGVVALLKSEDPTLKYSEITKILYGSTDRNVVAYGEDCGGVSEQTFPNNGVGWGRVNALKAVQTLRKSKF